MESSVRARGARLSATSAVVVGVLALVSALAAGHLVAGFVGASASPVLAVGSTAIDLTPSWLKEFAVRTFGTADKLVLLLGMGLVLAGFAAIAGLASRRRPAPGLALIGVLALVGVAAVLARPDLGQLAVLAPLVSGVVGAAVFGSLHSRALEAATEPEVHAQPEVHDEPEVHEEFQVPAEPGVHLAGPRRRFLVQSLGVAAGAGVLGVGGACLAGGSPEAARRAIGRIEPGTTAPPTPNGADFVADGTPPVITPNADFYRIDTALIVPEVHVADWRLRVHGMVDRPLTLTYDQLRRRPLVERTITMACVSNEVGGPYISTSRSTGVELGALLAEAGVRPGAEQLYSTSVDGFTAGSPLDVVLQRDRGALLALAMNGEPLPVEHGFPVRIVVPGLYGYVSATKWLTDLEVTTWAERQGYWIPRGWSREAPIKTQSRIDAPQRGSNVDSGRVVVAGTAWAPHTGIRAVEVRLDEGPWQRARLAREVNVDTWRMWRAELDVPPGEHSVSCRATDADGYVQIGERRPVAPDGATGWHTVRFEAS